MFYVIIQNNEKFQSKIEIVQYRTYLVITGIINGTSRERLYDELSQDMGEVNLSF